MPQFALMLMAVGGVSKGISAKTDAQMSKINLEMQSGIAEQNARISELGYESEMIAGERAKQKSQLTTANLKSAQKVRMAASGVALSGDSQQNILNSTDILGEIDANTIESNAIRNAWGYKVQKQDYLTQAKMAKFGAKTINPNQAMATSLLGSATQVASSYYGAKG
jgi:hypothetical protein